MKRSVVQQIAQLPPKQQELFPDIKVDLEPVFEVTTPAPDMEVVAEAIKGILLPKQDINVTVMEPPEEPEPPKVIDIEVTERDARGGIKKLRLTQIVTGD